MSNTNFDELLNAGCHFGHLTRKWNPKMAPYIFMERNEQNSYHAGQSFCSTETDR